MPSGLFYFLVASLLLGTSLALPQVATTANSYSNHSRFGLMFDAGSSGTRLFIYQWYEGSIPIVWGAPVYQPLNSSDWTVRVTPGISTFVGPNKAKFLKDYFQPFLEFVKARITEDHYDHTYLVLYATAGMRLLPQGEQTEILAAIRQIFKSWPFVLTSDDFVRVISGVDEGVFGWMTTNYLVGTFAKNDPMATFGALDLGGASTQLTFVPSTPVPPSLGGTSVTVGGVLYPLYSVSYLGYGVDQASLLKNQLLAREFCNDPSRPCKSLVDYCTPNSWITFTNTPYGARVRVDGGSNYTLCDRNETAPLFNASKCVSCPIGDVYQPALRGKFYAMSAYYLPISVWGLKGNETSIKDIQTAATRWCSFSMAELRMLRPDISPLYLSSYCFIGTLGTSLLKHYGFDINDKHAITFTDRVGSTHLSWTLGAMVLAAEKIESSAYF